MEDVENVNRVNMRDVRQTLHGCALLQGIDDRTLARLARAAVLLRFRPGDHLWFQGMPALLVAIVWSGRVALESHDATIAAHEFVNGQIVGTPPFIGSTHYRTTAFCLEPTTIIAVDVQVAVECMSTDERLMQNVRLNLGT